MQKNDQQASEHINSSDDHPLITGLNPVQREAVLHQSGPLLVLAGAGSGKTRVITHRIAYLVECCGIWPSEIMAITFTNKAAAEMKERVEQLLGYNSRGMWIGTFHSMMLRLLRQHSSRLGFQSNFTILDSDDQQRLLKEILKELNIDDKLLTVRTVQNRISGAKNRMQTWESMEKSAGHDLLRRQTAEVFRHYQDALKRGNSMDFDDILVFSVQLLNENPDLLEAYQTRFKHILVDEYQDTNYVQYVLIRLLSGKSKNLCVVGDDDQSIYSFRGANIQNILDFEKDFKRSKVIKLEQNYRSTKTILGAANAVIEQNEARKSKRLWTDRQTGDPITFYRAYDQYDEARFVAREIQRLTSREERPIKAGDIGILYRVNALSRNLEFALREAGIQYHIYGGLRFYDRKEIRDLLAYLRLIFSPDDDLACSRIINVPRRGIGDRSIEQIRNLAAREGCSMMRIIQDCGYYPELSRVRPRLEAFARMIADLRQTMMDNQLTFAEFFEAIQEHSGLIRELIEQRTQGQEEAINRIENLKELISDALEFVNQIEAEIAQIKQMEDSAGADIPVLAQDQDELLASELTLQTLTESFLERTALYSDLDQESADNTVRLMTVHSAKGLEYDVVFLVGMEEGVFPGYRAFDEASQMEEERRLAYVAITRAKKHLLVSATHSRLLFGQTRSNLISRFITEIPDDFMVEIGGSRRENADSFSGRQRGITKDDVKGGLLGSFGLSADNLNRQARTNQTKRETLDVASLRVGDRLEHAKFGPGLIERIDRVANDAILTLNFSGQIKRLMANSAPLSKPAHSG